jgi:hypothetical protein
MRPVYRIINDGQIHFRVHFRVDYGLGRLFTNASSGLQGGCRQPALSEVEGYGILRRLRCMFRRDTKPRHRMSG